MGNGAENPFDSTYGNSNKDSETEIIIHHFKHGEVKRRRNPIILSNA